MTAQAQLRIAAAYSGHRAHLADELRALDLSIQLQAAKFRARTQIIERMATDRQVYISHEEVDCLLGDQASPDPEARDIERIRRRLEGLRNEIEGRVAASLDQGLDLPLFRLSRIFGLSEFEVQIVAICLAPELDRKYDRLYAYLQDDITRKKPSIDLALTLLCPAPAERWRARTCFAVQAPLFRTGLVEIVDDLHSPSGCSELAKFLKLDSRILNYLLGDSQIDGRLDGLVEVYRPDSQLETLPVEEAAKSRLMEIVERYLLHPPSPKRKLAVYCHGPSGVGKLDLALAGCARLGCPLLRVDLERLLARGAEAESLFKLAFREGLLLQAVLYLEPVEALRHEDSKAVLKSLARMMADYVWLVFLAGESAWHPGNLFEGMVFQAIALAIPGVPVREAVWRAALSASFPDCDRNWAIDLARRFRLTPGQIRTAVIRAEAGPDASDEAARFGLESLYAACREQSNQKLGELAVKLEARCRWPDIVLPDNKLNQLKEICAQARNRHRVFGDWGFDRKLSHGKGLSALFSGPPGTGKTLAAEVIARELGLDLYKVDLAGVVSKYIGETEKNLARIFHEAETGNAIVFFDEADALFGKRTEVSDAHDRYANIETSYLLQKMEAHEGIVLLATNLCQNMDDAFTRRLGFIVEFPFPDEASRLLIWKGLFPAQAPLGENIDFPVLARKFQIAGGNIKNIVLNAAFYAAERDDAIGMADIVRGAKREFEKMGKLWSEK